MSNGPYAHEPALLPQSRDAFYVLTKTHCGGYCIQCHPSKYVFTNTSRFLQSCLSGERDYVSELDERPASLIRTRYAPTLPQRAVHLVRNPFDNIVSRFHLSVKRQRRIRDNKRRALVSNWEDRLDDDDEESAVFSSDPLGFEKYCEYLDSQYREREEKFFRLTEPKSFTNVAHADALEQYRDLPCRMEWYRYIQW
jgi:hypothetical protein